ncbi:MAG: hypothetical protein U9N33_11385, partial [Campylobacterota bacterium]|nr:hypothetical protein [Campylobacterota bacterium]
MHKIVLFISLGFVGLFALDNVWTKDTQGLSKKKSDEIIKSYEAGDNSKLDFADDPKSKTPYYGFKENIFVIGVSVGGASYSEDLSNITGSKTSSYSSYNAKLTIGKDFTLWHENYTQPTRIYLTYVFTKLDNDLDFTTWTVGIRENMEYWSLYETDSYKIY